MAMPGLDGRHGLWPMVAQYHALTAFTGGGGGWEMEVAVRSISSSSAEFVGHVVVLVVEDNFS